MRNHSSEGHLKGISEELKPNSAPNTRGTGKKEREQGTGKGTEENTREEQGREG